MGEDTFSNSNTAKSVVETSTAQVLLNGCDISYAGITGEKPVSWKKVNLLLWHAAT